MGTRPRLRSGPHYVFLCRKASDFLEILYLPPKLKAFGLMERLEVDSWSNAGNTVREVYKLIIDNIILKNNIKHIFVMEPQSRGFRIFSSTCAIKNVAT